MWVSELAVQSVRGFSPGARAAFRSGYWVLNAPAGQQPPLAAAVLEVLYPSGAAASLLAPGAKSAKARVGLVGNDQAQYRVVRELGGAGALQRLVAEKQSFETVASDPQEIAQFLRSQVGLPDRTAFERLFCFALEQLPSRRPAAAGKPSGPAAPTSAWSKMLDNKPTVSPATKLRELEKELEMSTEVERLQYRLDGITSEIFQQERVLRTTDALEDQLQQTRAALASAPTPDKLGLPGDILRRVQRVPDIEAKLKDGLDKLEAERASEEAEGAGVERLTALRPFWVGLALGAAALVGGAMASGAVRYLALLNMPAFGYSAFLAWRYVDDLQALDRKSRRGGRIADREKWLQDQYNQEMAPVKAAMAALKVDSPSDVVESFSQQNELKGRIQKLEAEISAKRSEPEYAEAAAKLEAMRKEQDALQAEIAQKGAYVRDVREVERDVEKAKAAMGAGKAEVTAMLAGGSQAPLADPCPPLMSLAATLFGGDIPMVAGLVKDRCPQYLSALTDKRWVGLELKADGTAAALASSGKSPVTSLPPKDVDLVYLALRLTLLEKYCARFKVPILVEGFLETLDAGKVPLLARMLKHLGTLGQVLHVTSHPALTQVADGTANV